MKPRPAREPRGTHRERIRLAGRGRGGQSSRMKFHGSDSSASTSRRIISAPTSPAKAFSTPANQVEDGTKSTPKAALSRTRAARLPLLVKTSRSPRPPSFEPSQAEADACGSRSTTRVWHPISPSAAARFTVVVVFPLPPFWFVTAKIFIISRGPVGQEVALLDPGITTGSTGEIDFIVIKLCVYYNEVNI